MNNNKNGELEMAVKKKTKTKTMKERYGWQPMVEPDTMPMRSVSVALLTFLARTLENDCGLSFNLKTGLWSWADYTMGVTVDFCEHHHPRVTLWSREHQGYDNETGESTDGDAIHRDKFLIEEGWTLNRIRDVRLAIVGFCLQRDIECSDHDGERWPMIEAGRDRRNAEIIAEAKAK